jgi:hypothetical protein
MGDSPRAHANGSNHSLVARRIDDSTWVHVWIVGFSLVQLVVMIPLYRWADHGVDTDKQARARQAGHPLSPER